jgi:release factor glutamine methyltransferase
LISIGDVLNRDVPRIGSTLGLDASEARIEVQVLLQHVLQVARSYLAAHPEQVLDAAQCAGYEALLARRLYGEPISYILGEREFFGLKFRVTRDTLIPRPDTELLVECALQLVPQTGAYSVLDLGTGSGAIALSIAHARPGANVMAVDVSEAALKVAADNAARLGISNVRFLQSDWFIALDGQRFDLIVANPPYIAARDVHLNRGDVRFEPPSALVSGADGLDDIRRIVRHAEDHLQDDACILLEHGYDQSAQVRELLQQHGFGEVFSARDIAGIDRVSGGIRPK